MKGFVTAIMISMLLVTGCKIMQPVQHTEHETVREVFRDTTIYVPGSAVSVNLDSSTLADIGRRLTSVKDTVYYPAPGGKTTLRFYRDKDGNVQADCATAAQTYSFLLKELERVKTSKEIITKTEKQTPWWNWVIMGVLIALLIVQQFKRI